MIATEILTQTEDQRWSQLMGGWQSEVVGLGLVLLMCTMGAGPVVAQSTADAYFHEAAKAYVANEAAAARRAVKQGLAVAPSDPRLRALQEKLRQNRRSRPKADSSSSSESKRDGGEGKGADSSSGEGEGRSESADRERPDRDREESNDQGTAGPRTSPAQEAPPRAPDTVRPGRGGRPVDTLSRKQAERLLQALEGQERRLLRQIRRRSAPHRTVEKDW